MLRVSSVLKSVLITIDIDNVEGGGDKEELHAGEVLAHRHHLVLVVDGTWRVARVLVPLIDADGASRSVVGDLGAAVLINHHIVRLEVTVANATSQVEVLDTHADLA